MESREPVQFGLSKDVQSALLTTTHDGWLNWIGDIPQEHVASTVAAIAQEQLLLAETRRLMDRSDCFQHPTIQHFIDRYKIVEQVTDHSLIGLKEFMLTIIESFSLCCTQARMQLANDIRLLDGELSKDLLQEEIQFCNKENEKMQALKSLFQDLLGFMKKNYLPEEFLARVAVYFPQISLTSDVFRSSDISQFVELYDLLSSAILKEEEVENRDTMQRYRQRCYCEYSLLSPAEYADILEKKQKETDQIWLERKQAIKQLSELSYDIRQLPRDFLHDQKKRQREDEQVLIKKCHDTGTDYEPFSLKGVGTIYDLEIPEEEFIYLISSGERDSCGRFQLMKTSVDALKEKILYQTIRINKLQLQCDVLSTLYPL